MASLINEIRCSVRSLLKQKGFTLIAVVTLALGIGANTAIFSVVNAVLLRPLPFKEPERLVLVWERRANSGATEIPVSAHEFAAWRERSHSFQALALLEPSTVSLTGRGDPVSVTAARVSVEFFPVLGVPPLLGRTFVTGEDQSGDSRVVLLSQKLWTQRFGADRNVINQSVILSDQSYTIVGVMPTLEFMPDVLLPINLPGEVQKVGKHSDEVIGRLKPGEAIDQVQTELATIAHQLEEEIPNDNLGHGVQVVALHQDLTGSVQRALLILFGAVGFVLLIACANVANLLLTRAAARQKEMAIRTALGASRWRLVRQTLTESLLLAFTGGGLGLLSAFWLVQVFRQITAINLPRLDQVSIDRRVLMATIGFSAFTGLLAGIVPAWRTSEFELHRWMNEGTRSTPGATRRRIGAALVVVEIALAVILLVGGGLMLKSFVRLVRVDPGFDPHQVLRLDLSLPGLKYKEPQQQKAFYEELIERLKGLPGVESVGATTNTPLGTTDNWDPFAIEGRPAPPPGQQQQAATRVVSSDYFRTLKIPLRKGRFFANADARVALPLIRWYEQQPYPAHHDDPQPAPAVIINETMARLYWPNEDPLGQRLRIIVGPWMTIVGVVGDVRHSGLTSLPNPEMYLSDLQEPSSSLDVMVRTKGNPLALASAAREQVKAIDKELPLSITTMDEIFANSVAGQRFNTQLLGAFASLALILAMIGVFGVINYSVAQRTHEIGIRIALGAARRNIFNLVVSQGLFLALLGVAIGSVGAFGLTRLITGLLFDVSPTDAMTFVMVGSIMMAVALLACYLPARRAIKVDPLVALKYE
jgi:putative ABC transport system permease protein